MTDLFSFIAPQPWTRDAACRHCDESPDLWFEVGNILRSRGHSPATRRALAICNECPVRVECAQYALDNDIEHGIWGGLTPSQRRTILRRKRREGAA